MVLVVAKTIEFDDFSNRPQRLSLASLQCSYHVLFITNHPLMSDPTPLVENRSVRKKIICAVAGADTAIKARVPLAYLPYPPHCTVHCEDLRS